MIPTISDCLYRLHHEKAQMLSQAEKRRAFRLVCGLTALISFLVLMWILYR